MVEEVEKKQCCKCRGRKALEMFSGENATTCNGCLAHRKNRQTIIQKELGSCRRHIVKNIRKKRRHTIKNIIGGK